ncbi:unnamed protein product [Acanthoscelides obtectus]|uniref:Tetraspanin n=1 Tax=Acanthoscelides obtectus TaxID=200917 RepID=A0A9P0M7T8_ACAOB|nr:unnamed protein product [Acanthoscelides obtectus]CAK1675374.1 hypothetical protein AOBTE_LOCUS30176 [Acanthoscelides obtectus]
MIIITSLLLGFAILRISYKTLEGADQREVEYCLIDCLLLLSFAVIGLIACFFPSDKTRAKLYAIYTTGTVLLVVYQIFAIYHVMTDFSGLEMTRVFLTKKFNAYEENKVVVDWLQDYWQCCGIGGAEYWTAKNQTIPDSCRDNDGQVNDVGCVDLFYGSKKTNLAVFVFCYFSNLGLSIAGGVFGFRLARSLRQALWHDRRYSDVSGL